MLCKWALISLRPFYCDLHTDFVRFFLHLISEILKRGWSKVFHFFFVQFTWICKVKLYNDSVCLRIPMVPSHLIVCFPLQMFYNFWIRWFDSLWLLVLCIYMFNDKKYVKHDFFNDHREPEKLVLHWVHVTSKKGRHGKVLKKV